MKTFSHNVSALKIGQVWVSNAGTHHILLTGEVPCMDEACSGKRDGKCNLRLLQYEYFETGILTPTGKSRICNSEDINDHLLRYYMLKR